MTNFYFFNGFLGEKESLDYGPHRVDNQDDNFCPVWGDPGRQIAKRTGPGDKIFVVNYPNRKGFLELLSGQINWFEFWRRTIFCLDETIDDVDKFCAEFAKDFDSHDELPVFIGLSMGGRVALKLQEYIPCYSIGMAPPLAAEEVSWKTVSKGEKRVEVFYSQYDWMIWAFDKKYSGTTLGYHGAPKNENDLVKSIDISRYPSQKKRGHGGFMPVGKILERHSEMFDQLKTKKVATTPTI